MTYLPSDPIVIGAGAVRAAEYAGRGIHPEHPADDGRRARALPPMPKADTPSTVDTVAVPRATRPGERPRMQRIVPLGTGALVPEWRAVRVPIQGPAEEGGRMPIGHVWIGGRSSFSADDLRGDDAARVYAHLVAIAAAAARKGRMLAGSTGRRSESTVDGVTISEWTDPVPSIPAAHRIEDEETGADAVAACWHRVSLGRAATIDVPFLKRVAQYMGTRASQHRLRERSGLVESVDHRLPQEPVWIGGEAGKAVSLRAAFEAGTLTMAELVARVPRGRRAAFERAVAHREYGRARKILKMDAAESTAPV